MRTGEYDFQEICFQVNLFWIFDPKPLIIKILAPPLR